MHQVCQSNLYKYVKVTTTDGTIHRGYIVDIDQEKVTLGIEREVSESRNDERSRAPFLFWTLPLFALTAIAARRRRHPYPSYYPYAPGPVQPSYSYPGYGYPGYGYPPYGGY